MIQNNILYFLKTNQGYLSGEDISRQLKISRAAVWKNIQELRGMGYNIVAVPHLGYRLESVPDKLYDHEIQYQLGTKVFGQKIFYYDATNSTMDIAVRLGLDGMKEGTLIMAETQHKGRGRMGRAWSSPKGKGIYLSLILRPALTPADGARITLMAAVAVCEAIQHCTGIDARIKWPNDILIGGKKLAGILTELNAEMDRIRFMVLGLGINVNTPPHALPTGATSLKIESGRHVSRVELTQEILRRLEQWYGRLHHQGFGSVIARWKELSSTLGRRVTLSLPRGVIEGEAVDLDERGALIIEQEKGKKMTVLTGDVVQIP